MCHVSTLRRFSHTACILTHIPLAVTTSSWNEQLKGERWLEKHHFFGDCCLWARRADEIFLEHNASATISSCTVCHVTALIVFSGAWYAPLTTERFFEVAIESWPEWNLNPRPLNSIQMLQQNELSSHEFNLHSELALYGYFNFIVCSVPHFISAVCLRQSPHLF